MPLNVALIDHGNCPRRWGIVHQTRMPAAEAAIEFVLLKLQ